MIRRLAIPLAAIAGAFTITLLGGAPAANAGVSPVFLSVDCDAGTGGIQSNCVYPAAASVTVGVVFSNNSGGAIQLGTFNFNVVHPNDGLFDAPNNPDPFDGNPNFTAGPTTDWACGPPNPSDDTSGVAPGEVSFISCFNALATGPTIPNGGTLQLATVTYNVTGTGVENFSLTEAAVADQFLSEVGSCNLPVSIPMSCFSADIQIGGSAATNTPTNTPTATNTAAPTATACVGASCPTPTPLTFVTVTPTPAPGTATPAGGQPTAPPAGTAAPGQPTAPSGTTGGGGSAPITLPDTGSGGLESPHALANSVLMAAAIAAAVVLGGGLWLTASTVRRQGEN